MALEPITRQEKIIAGQDLTPITRLEKFLKQYGGSSGSGGGTVLDENGKLLNSVLPEGYPYETEPILTELIPGQTVTFIVQGGMGLAKSPVNADIVAGRTYIVIFDGKEYECVGATYNGDSYIGNMKMSGLEDTGEPFSYARISGQQDYTWIAFNAETEHTISLSGYVTKKIPISEEFLPEKHIIIDTANLPTDATGWRELHNEIENAWNARKDIYLDMYGDGLPPVKALSWLNGILSSVSVSPDGKLKIYALEAYKSDGGSFKTYTVDLTEVTQP